MTQTELDILVAQIGEEILARVRRAGGVRAAQKGEGSISPTRSARAACSAAPRPARRTPRRSSPPAPTAFPRASGSRRSIPSIASLIDHTILKPDATRADVVKICREARQYNFASVCVNPYWVPLVQRGADRIAGEGLHRGRVPAGRHQHGGEGCRDGRGAARRARRRSTW